MECRFVFSVELQSHLVGLKTNAQTHYKFHWLLYASFVI